MAVVLGARHRVEALARAQDGVVHCRQAADGGLSHQDIATIVHRGEWRRVTTGVYFVDAQLFPETPRRAVLRAALLRYGDAAALWGASAAEVLQIEGVVGHPDKPWVLLPVEQTVGQPGDARLRFRDSPRAEMDVVDGFRVVVPTRTLAELVALVDRPTGLSLLDSALHKQRISAEELDVIRGMACGRRGALQARELLDIADGRAASPLESRVRLACVDGDVPPDELQWEVRDSYGHLLGIGDMAWRRKRRRPLVGEADGEQPHAELAAVFRDRRRGNDFTSAAVDIIRFVWRDTSKPAYIASTVRRALTA